MEARQEVRLKEAEAAETKREAANRVRFAEPTASIIDLPSVEVHIKSTSWQDLVDLAPAAQKKHALPRVATVHGVFQFRAMNNASHRVD